MSSAFRASSLRDSNVVHELSSSLPSLEIFNQFVARKVYSDLFIMASGSGTLRDLIRIKSVMESAS